MRVINYQPSYPTDTIYVRFTVPRLSNAEETQASQDDAAVMAAIKAREKAAMQTAAPSPKRLGGGRLSTLNRLDCTRNALHLR